jgi:hypothetical protein
MFSFNRRFENRDDIAGGSSAVLDDRARCMVQQPVVLDVADPAQRSPKRSSSQKVIAGRDHTKKVFGSTSFCAVTM